jgi:hypothetical protein
LNPLLDGRFILSDIVQPKERVNVVWSRLLVYFVDLSKDDDMMLT